MNFKSIQDHCSEKVSLHRSEAKTILMFTAVLISVIFGLIYLYLQNRDNINEHLAYIIAFVIIIFFGVLMNVYNFHIKEASRYEFIETAFRRIEVADEILGKDNNKDEIISSLTKNAFSFETTSNSIFKKGNVQNPFPGHPTLEVLTSVINKLSDLISKKEEDKEPKTKPE
jgi:hypothetical protein